MRYKAPEIEILIKNHHEHLNPEYIDCRCHLMGSSRGLWMLKNKKMRSWINRPPPPKKRQKSNGIWDSINAIHHINRRAKTHNHLKSYRKKAFDEVQCCLMINTLNISMKRRKLPQPEKQLQHKTQLPEAGGLVHPHGLLGIVRPNTTNKTVFKGPTANLALSCERLGASLPVLRWQATVGIVTTHIQYCLSDTSWGN